MSEFFESFDEAPHPLTDRERKLLKRMFSDFLEVPSEWLNSLKAKLESDPPILGQAALGGAITSGFIVGEVRWWPFAIAPDTHWAMCDGQAVSRTLGTYKALADKLIPLGFPAPFGPGDGSTTFTLPNFKRRVLVHRDSAYVPMDTIGETGGLEDVTLILSQVPPHSHNLLQDAVDPRPKIPTAQGTPGSNNWCLTFTNWDNVTLFKPPMSAGPTDAQGGGGSHTNLQPYMVLNAIIYLG